MTCYHPITCVYPSLPDDEGKKRLLFSLPEGYAFDGPLVYKKIDPDIIEGYQIKIPCGRCIGCRLDYSRHWAIRSYHEAFMHNANCFVTLTFNDKYLPNDNSVHKDFIQRWLKRFRKYYGDGIRYMLCGEYGSKKGRPHYHLVLYGFDFDDKYVYSERRGNLYYRSPSLEKIWTLPGCSESAGFSVIGECTFESSAYVARYVTKKVFGSSSKKHYSGREPEFMLMSRMPGLGNEFFNRYYHDMFNTGFVLLPNKFKAPIPRYYVSLLEKTDKELFDCYKLDKLQNLYNNLFNEDIHSTRERLLAREELKKVKCDKLLRFYEDEALLHSI